MKFLVVVFLVLVGCWTLPSCSTGHVANPNNICIEVTFIEGCFLYANERKCLQCEYSNSADKKDYELTETGLCTFSEHPEPCCLEEEYGQCLRCNRGLQLQRGQCTYKQIIGCLQKGFSGCLNCASGYNLVNGICKKGIKHCEEYSREDLTTCMKCENGFSLAHNFCLKNIILGCKSLEEEVCSECQFPFRSSGNHCEIPNCKDYNDFGCERCNCGFYITEARTCEKIQSGCIRYQRGRCTDCYPPYRLQGLSCVIEGCIAEEKGECTKCQEDYILESGNCRLKNCLIWQHHKCKICQQNYTYQSGHCIETLNFLLH